ncbi:MAG: hypothetical protein A3F09_03490 [Chlamydiae bacterium RIFCSPHIGHO2_12_FULL_49_11]|nr:MAG: hypothetical protein A3F09_03490 [Chlamydiae bacterium RIFCSPHIGHO2_12_FULL_49_11]
MKHNRKAVLWNLLKISEKEEYASYFQETYWSSIEFAALVRNLLPKRYKEHILDPNNTDTKLLDQCSSATIKVRIPILKWLRRNPKIKFLLVEDDILMPCATYIKWAAENNIPCTHRFFKQLPNPLQHLFIEFLPRSIALRGDKYSAEHHRASYQEKADELIEENEGIAPLKIYDNPAMQLLSKSFLKSTWKPRTYKPRILKRWIAACKPRAIGRPKKDSKK